jgi:hypothetical protein
MTSRFRIALVAALAAFVAVGADTAAGCISVGISGYPGTAHAGDPVHFSVSNLGKGAHYTISFNGGILAEGVQTEEGVPIEGTFTMPDLGSKRRTVLLGVVFEHSDVQGSQQPLPQQLVYEPTAAPPPPPPPPPPPLPPPPPPVTTLRQVAPAPVTRTRPEPPARVRQQPMTTATPPRRVHTPLRAVRGVPVPAPAHASAPQAPRPAAVAVRQKHGRQATRLRVLPVRAAVPAPEIRLAPLRSTPDAAPRAGNAGTSRYLRWVVLALGILFVLGVNAANGWLRLRRRSILPTDDEAASLEIEAELQEIVAEEQAKRKLRSQR